MRKRASVQRLGFWFWARAFIATLCMATGISCAPTNSRMQADFGTMPTPGYLAPGDSLKIAFPGAPEMTQTQKVRPDGKISLPMVGEVAAAGKRLGELQQQLTGLYKPQLQNSEVVVSLEASAIPVYVGGAVAKPGRVVLDRPMTVLEGIMEAGGFAPGLANPHRVVLIRVEGGRHMTHMVDLSPSLKGRETDATWLKPYDVIYVQESGIF